MAWDEEQEGGCVEGMLTREVEKPASAPPAPPTRPRCEKLAKVLHGESSFRCIGKVEFQFSDVRFMSMFVCLRRLCGKSPHVSAMLIKHVILNETDLSCMSTHVPRSSF